MIASNVAYPAHFCYFCIGIKKHSLMSTIIYPSPVFGPIHSRRLGVSLGINLQPSDGKVCTFDCLYCECGFNKERRPHLGRPSRGLVAERLENTLKAMASQGMTPDVLTFAGNGEPTGHPEFAEIIDDTLRLRDKCFPKAKVSVLSNATFTHKKSVHDALMRVDNNIQKLDTVCADYIKLVDRPTIRNYDVNRIIGQLKAFNGHVIIQTMFMTGHTSDGISVDNTSEEYVVPWINAVESIRPQSVMVYTIDRETPEHGLWKASREALDAIRDMVLAKGIDCTASY